MKAAYDLVALCVAVSIAALVAAGERNVPLIIGHRGASGHRPEHTIASYRLAAEMGADFIELTRRDQGRSLSRHENEIGGTTDVAIKFLGAKTTKRIDGADVTGWFTEDFTLSRSRRCAPTSGCRFVRTP